MSGTGRPEGELRRAQHEAAPASARGTIVVLNSGSSSVKFAAYANKGGTVSTRDRLLHGKIDGIGRPARLLAWGRGGEVLSGEDG